MRCSRLNDKINCIKATVLILLIQSLTACSQQDEFRAQSQDYIDRVARVLVEKSIYLPDYNLPALPPHRERHQEITEIREGLIDVLDLRHCDLLNLVAERNSSLGKVAAPSLKMVYEVNFLNKLNQCIPDLESQPNIDREILVRLKDIQKTKSANLPKVLWNAVYTGAEIEATLSLNEPSLTKDPNDYSQAITAFETLGATIAEAMKLQSNSNMLAIKLSAMESEYESIYKTPLGTPIIKSLVSMTQTLNTAAQVIENRLERRPLCFKSRTTPEARILKNVFVKYYAGIIQPQMAVTHKLAQRWYQVHNLLHEQLTRPDKIAEYSNQVFLLSHDTSFWNRYVLARDRHTKAWQSILSQCNLMPKRN